MEPTKELADELFRDKVRQARAASPEERFLAGPRLFERSCRLMAAGFRHRFPNASSDEIRGMIEEQLRRLRRLEESIMTGDEATLVVVRVLNDLEIPYMLTGSMATNFHGLARATQDVDFVVELAAGKGIAEIAQRLGTEFTLDPQASFESVTVSQRFVFHLRGSLFKVEIFLLRNDPFDQARFSRRIKLEFDDFYVWAPTIEDIVVNKLWWSHVAKRTKDLEDVRNVIGTRGDVIDWPYVYSWCDQHGTRDLLDSIRNSIPPM
jgi:hypothetical protein